MYKWMYDRIVKQYEKESKEELVQRIMAMEEIECSDRCFANQCEAGTAICSINELFEALEELSSGFSYEKAAKVYELSELAKTIGIILEMDWLILMTIADVQKY